MANSRAIARLISEFGREDFAFWRLRPEADPFALLEAALVLRTPRQDAALTSWSSLKSA
jgi:hypothetical protein